MNVATAPPSMEKSQDGVHFTQAAQALLAETVWHDLERVLRESKPATRATRATRMMQVQKKKTTKKKFASRLLMQSRERRASMSGRKRRQPVLYMASPMASPAGKE